MAKRPSNPPVVKVVQPAQPPSPPAESAAVITKDPTVPPENPAILKVNEPPTEGLSFIGDQANPPAQPAPQEERPPAIGRCIDAVVRNKDGELTVRPGIITRVYTSPTGKVESHVGAVVAMNPFGDETGTKDERALVVSILAYDPELNEPGTYCWPDLSMAAANL